MSVSAVVVDDQALFLRGLELIFNADHPSVHVVATTTVPDDASSLVTERHPDIALIDLMMPPNSGLSTIEQVCGLCPEVKVVAFSGTEDLDLVLAAMQRGAVCFLPKCNEPDDLVIPMQLIVKGWTVVPQVVTRHLLFSSRPIHTEGARQLTEEQISIWCMISHGWTDDDIAQNLACSDRTAKRHVRDTIYVLGAKNRVHAAALGGQAGSLMTDPIATP